MPFSGHFLTERAAPFIKFWGDAIDAVDAGASLAISRATSRHGCEPSVGVLRRNIMPKYDLNDVTDFIYEFTKAMAGIGEDLLDRNHRK
jgi:hypothetical protein